MKKMNSKGMTLVEVLAITIIGAIATLLITNILFSLFSHEKRITTTAQVRDVADYYLESLTRNIYALNENNVCEEVSENQTQQQTNSNEITKAKSIHYMVIGNVDESTGKCKGGKITGFKKANKNDHSFSLYINNVKISDNYPNISISDKSMLQKSGNVYQITLVLEYNNQEKTFKKEVHSIPSS